MTRDSIPDTSKRKNVLNLIIFLLGFLAFSSFCFGIVMFCLHWPREDINPSEWGDYIGGHISGSVAFLGTVLFFIGLLLQQQELREARSVFIAQRDIAQKELQQIEIQTNAALDEQALAVLLDIAEIRTELRVQAASIVADDAGHWKRKRDEIRRSYDATTDACNIYLKRLNNNYEKEALVALLGIDEHIK